MTETEKKTGKIVDPMKLRGFQDYFPEDMIERNRVVETIRKVYEKYGFVPIDTPVLEYLVTLIGTGGDETNKELFRLESPEREPIAMRFDLTVPFARLVAQYPEKMKLPFRRYHIGPVFRADEPAPGRFRQFTQFDIDAAGSDSVFVDAEVVAAIAEALGALGLKGASPADPPGYRIQLNNRKLMDALLEDCGIVEPKTTRHILAVIDKFQKKGLENIKKELGPGYVDSSGDPVRGVGLSSAVIDRIIKFILIKGETREGVLEAITGQLSQSETSATALAEMKDLASALNALQIGQSEAVFDPSLTRGLAYYTGPVFEAVLPRFPKIGSVAGGGRYDHLVERFSDVKIPATGASIGLDRLMTALTEAGKIRPVSTMTQVLVVTMKGVAMNEYLAVARELRALGIPTEVYFGGGKSGMKDQLAHANSKEIPIAVIIGPDELQSGTVSVKNLHAGKEARAGIESHEKYVGAGKAGQATVTRGELGAAIFQMLGG